ncbi:general odorant-binding protein 28a-like [Condylostylus longicornis]|uniref:general odorant-binding protein 28a-like n=1 Tax=Condylostylus longicornis TaxID=2530218 RepID=UPI00244E2B4A|nr:general odorant-binding protein 28a-like [Condylostylus longicornis]
MEECRTEQNVSDDVIGKFVTKQINPEVKCFAACVMGKVGLMKEDNTLNKIVALEGAKDFFGNDPELIKKLETVIKSCSGETDADKCEAFHKIFTCLENKRIEEGIEMIF